MFKNRTCAALFSVLLFLSYPLQAEYRTIHTIHTIHEVEKDLAELDQNSLVIFDVDNVLIAAKSAINRPVGDAYRDGIWDQYASHLSEKEATELKPKCPPKLQARGF